ncbi:MAG: xanthine dehydrogenase family protein subunit M [Desulfobacteraceae bacterium]|nr:xanthine dehydrogenase family protein subunit M [Desulfobacteraceae bacterium]
MKSFKHFNATSVDEAVSLLKEYQGKAKLIAGGTDLLGSLKDEILPDYPVALINIKAIPGLNDIDDGAKGLKIGPSAKLIEIARSPVIRKKYPVLSEAAETVATPEIRNMATLSGNLCQETRCWYYRYPHEMGGRILCYRKGSGPCHALKGDNRYHAIMGGKACFAVCPSDMAIALTALDARLKITGPNGDRDVQIKEAYNALGNVLEPDEFLAEIHVPQRPKGTKQTFIKFTLRKPVDFAVVSVASVIMQEDGLCKDARIALGAVAPTPIRATETEEALKGEVIDAKTAERAAEAAVSGAKPMSMNAYKIEITKALVKRAILS